MGQKENFTNRHRGLDTRQLDSKYRAHLYEQEANDSMH